MYSWLQPSGPVSLWSGRLGYPTSLFSYDTPFVDMTDSCPQTNFFCVGAASSLQLLVTWHKKWNKVIIMAYGSTPYVGMPWKKIVATLKVHKWHTRNICVRLVKGLYKPYQALPSVSMGNGNITFAKVPDQQVTKTGKSSIFWLSSFSSLSHASTITVEATSTIQTRKMAQITGYCTHYLSWS